MKSYTFPFEYLLPAVCFAQSVALWSLSDSVQNPKTIAFGVWFATMALKTKVEGSRPNFALLFLFELILLFQPFLIVNVLLVVIMVSQITKAKAYKFPEIQGQYLPGFRTLSLEKNLNVAVVYPTLEKTKDSTYSENFNILDRAHHAFKKVLPFVPRGLIYLLISFVQHLPLGVNKNAKMAPTNSLDSTNKKHPVIIFNHALAVNNMVYMSLFREWASRGYVVISIDTDELVLTPHQGPADPCRPFQLQNRFKQNERVLEFINDKARYQRVFGDHVELDTQRVNVAGHSFGGAAAVYTSYKSDKITGSCLLLDPWLWPLEFSLFDKPMNKPLLIIRSQTYYERNQKLKLYEKMEALVKANKKHVSFSCYFEGTGHSFPCDLPYFIPGLLVAEGMKIDQIENVTIMSNEMIDMFLNIVQENGKTDKDAQQVKEDVIQRFKQLFNRKKYPQLLQVDTV